jgi:hypothetical protein
VQVEWLPCRVSSTFPAQYSYDHLSLHYHHQFLNFDPAIPALDITGLRQGGHHHYRFHHVRVWSLTQPFSDRPRSLPRGARLCRRENPSEQPPNDRTSGFWQCGILFIERLGVHRQPACIQPLGLLVHGLLSFGRSISHNQSRDGSRDCGRAASTAYTTDIDGARVSKGSLIRVFHIQLEIIGHICPKPSLDERESHTPGQAPPYTIQTLKSRAASPLSTWRLRCRAYLDSQAAF